MKGSTKRLAFHIYCRMIHTSTVSINDETLITIEYYLATKDESVLFVLFCFVFASKWMKLGAIKCNKSVHRNTNSKYSWQFAETKACCCQREKE